MIHAWLLQDNTTIACFRLDTANVRPGAKKRLGVNLGTVRSTNNQKLDQSIAYRLYYEILLWT
jgi:hypothetical protein